MAPTAAARAAILAPPSYNDLFRGQSSVQAPISAALADDELTRVHVQTQLEAAAAAGRNRSPKRGQVRPGHDRGRPSHRAKNEMRHRAHHSTHNGHHENSRNRRHQHRAESAPAVTAEASAPGDAGQISGRIEGSRAVLEGEISAPQHRSRALNEPVTEALTRRGADQNGQRTDITHPEDRFGPPTHQQEPSNSRPLNGPSLITAHNADSEPNIIQNNQRPLTQSPHRHMLAGQLHRRPT